MAFKLELRASSCVARRLSAVRLAVVCLCALPLLAASPPPGSAPATPPQVAPTPQPAPGWGGHQDWPTEPAPPWSPEPDRDWPTEPRAPTGPDDVLVGTIVRANGCDAFDIANGGHGERMTVMLRWSTPESRRDWLQAQFEQALEAYEGDLWLAFVELGGGLRQATSGFAIRGYETGSVADCGGMGLPVVDVSEVVGAWDIGGRGLLPRTAEPVVPGGFDPGDRALSDVIEAVRGAEGGGVDEMTIEVSGVADPALDCPPWALGGSRVSDHQCGSRRGFVDLRFADADLRPSVERRLERLLDERGVTDLRDLPLDEAREVRAQAAQSALRGPFRFRGHFTGEISYRRGTEALYLTPVFVVEGRAE